MLKEISKYRRVYIACGYTDLRYGVDGLAGLIQYQFELNPYDTGTLFLFCGRRSDRIKGLLWEEDGFLLLYKRIGKGRFLWPRNREELKELSEEEYCRLLEGLNIEKAIKKYEVSPEFHN